MKPLLRVAIIAAAGLSASQASAQPPAPASAPKPAVAKSTAPRGPAKPRSDKSIACSKQADGKNLHGAARSSFMRTCKK